MQSSVAARAKRFVDFLNSSISPFHAVDSCKQFLASHGFQEIFEGDNWTLTPGQRYFFTRNYSSIIAFYVGNKFSPTQGGFKIVGGHTDSPCLKVRPNSAATSQGFLEVSVQLYGGGLWHTWFDRDLSLGGRALVRGPNGEIQQKLVRVNKPILRIPNLAIHLQSASEREAFKFNAETHLQPVIATVVKSQLDQPASAEKPRHHSVLLDALASEANCDPSHFLDFELCLHDFQPAAVIGAKEEFVSSGRLDNLTSCFSALEALVESLGAPNTADEQDVRMVACFDHEEVGSETMQGAASMFLESTLQRILATTTYPGTQALPADAYAAAARRSFFLSVDMAHGVHPNYPEKHQELHRPQIQKGVVVKQNANQRYATDSIGATIIRELGQNKGIPVQEFVVRNDSPCGSTIGPLVAARTGIKTVDLGVPQLSMHSVRELCGVDDVSHLTDLLQTFFSDFRSVPESVLRF